MMAIPHNTSRSQPFSRTLMAALAVLSVVSFGCHSGSRRSRDLLETRIRNHEQTITALQRSVSSLETERNVARREADTLRVAAEKKNSVIIPAEHAETQLRVSSIAISRMLSGSLDRDEKHGDELLTVLVAPTDATGETLRASGQLEVTAIDFAAATDQQKIGYWSFNRDRTRDMWHSGLIGRGIQVTVPWQILPASDSITIHARLTLPDGRHFDSTEAIRVWAPAKTADSSSVDTARPDPALPDPALSDTAASLPEFHSTPVLPAQ